MGHWQLMLCYNFVSFVLQILWYENAIFTLDVICPGCYFNGQYYNFNETVKINCNLWWVTGNSILVLQTGEGDFGTAILDKQHFKMCSQQTCICRSLFVTFEYCKHQSFVFTPSCTVLRLQCIKAYFSIHCISLNTKYEQTYCTCSFV